MKARCLCLLALLAAAPAHAQVRVNRCGTDIEPGGTNLAQALAAGGHITFSCPPGTKIRITRGHQVSGGTRVDGEGSVTLDAFGQPLTLFRANGSITLQRITIQNVTLPRGQLVTRASVLLASGDTVLEDVTILGSETPVLIRGNAQVRNSAFLSNRSWALAIDGEAQVDNSRFIGNETGLSVKSGFVRRCVFSQNTTGALRVAHATATVAVSLNQFFGNVGQGAILLSQRAGQSGPTTVVIKRNKFQDNANPAGGGAITVYDSIVGAPPAAVPALRQLPPARFALSYNRFEANRGANGGAILADLHETEGLASTGDIFLRNEASGAGGGIFWVGRSVLLTHNLFRANRATKGGALYADYRDSGARWVLANSLVAENVVTPPGAAVEVGPIEIRNVTIARNQGVGYAGNVHGSPPTLPQVFNTIFSDNRDGNCRGIAASGFRGANLQSVHRDCEGVAVEDPFLDAMYVPALGSKALMMGDVATCRAAPVSRKDIVFQSRATDDRCAVGAFERPPVRRAPRDPERRRPNG